MNLPQRNRPTRREFLGAGASAVIGSALAKRIAAADPPVTDPRGEGYIDAHVHVWSDDLVRYPLKAGFPKEKMRRPSFTPEDLFTHARPCGVTRVVLIQISYYGNDNSYMLDTMHKYPGVFSGVAVVDPDDKPRERMLALARQGVRGFRIGPGQASAEHWLDGDGMAAMWKCAADAGLAICPLINPQHLPALDRMSARFPETPVAIDHLARIGIDGQFREADIDTLCGLARHKNVRVKVSAFSALGAKKAPYLDLAPLIRRALNAYGPERLMWATDGPWQMMDGHAYRDSIDLIRFRLDFLTDHDRACLLRKTAENLFFQSS